MTKCSQRIEMPYKICYDESLHFFNINIFMLLEKIVKILSLDRQLLINIWYKKNLCILNNFDIISSSNMQ